MKNSIDEILKGVKTLGITGHIRPDGDCIGSCFGLYNYVRDNYKDIDVDIYLESIGPEFSYIAGTDMIKYVCDDKVYDLFIVLDCSDLDRIEPFISLFNSAKDTLCIDHHISNSNYANNNIVVGDASSASEVLYDLLDEKLISKNVAECIYTGIIHDTGVFKYSQTSEKTMKIAGFLMSKGINFTDIIDNSFYKKTYVQNQILGKVLLESILFFKGKCIFSVVSKKDMDFYGVSKNDLGGIVEQLRLTDGVEVAIFLYENDASTYKVSMRSKNYIDVSKIAVKYGGGGHIRAAGCTMYGSVHDIINNIGKQIEEQAGNYDKWNN